MTGSTCLICTDFTTDALPDAAVPFIRAWDGHWENTSLRIPEDELWFQTRDLSRAREKYIYAISKKQLYITVL